MYNGYMETTVGLHYHVLVGPAEVRLFDGKPLAGPYYDLVYGDLDDAYHALLGTVEGHIEGYLDEDDEVELYEALGMASQVVLFEEAPRAEFGLEELGWEFEIAVCSGCKPRGMN